MWTSLARLLVRFCPRLATAIVRERSHHEAARRKSVISLLAQRAERKKAVGKQTEPYRHWGDDAS